MDAAGLSHLAYYDFDQTGLHVPRHKVLRRCLRSISVGDIFELLQQGLIVLQVTSPSMKAEDTHEDTFVVGQVGHRLDVFYMGML
jgi:hypothetical protein